MLDHALARFVGQVEPAVVFVAVFQLGDDAVALRVVIKAAVALHHGVEGVFAGVTKGRMAQVVRQADGFGEIFVGAQPAGQRAAQLGNFQRVCEACAIVIALVEDEDLCLVLQAAEGSGVNDAVTVALVSGPRFRFGFRMRSPAALITFQRVGRQMGRLDLFQFLAQEDHASLLSWGSIITV